MYFDEKEVNIKLQSRPLKVVYLVRGKEDFISAISLYTHLWGGVANAIFVIPDNEEEATSLAISLYRLHPDYIFLPYSKEEETPTLLLKIIEDFPCWKWFISPEKIEEHSKGKFLELRNNKYLSHIEPVLEKYFPSKLEKSNIRSVKLGGSFDFELMLLVGLPTEYYGSYLENHLALEYFSIPIDLSELVKTSILLHEKTTPVDLTHIETTEESYNLCNTSFMSEEFISRSSDGRIFEIYLDGNNCIDAAATYWNSKKFSKKKRLYLAKELFVKNTDKIIKLILEVMPSTKILYLVVSLSQEEAKGLYLQIKEVLNKLTIKLSVEICYSNYKYGCIEPGLIWWEPERIKSIISSDRSVSFKLPTPYGHENTKFCFGFNAEITFIPSGTKFSMPLSKKMPLMLVNELERIEKWQEKQEGFWLRKNPIWCLDNELSGTTASGNDYKLFLHSSSTIVSHYIKFGGFSIRSNPQTKYAQGFIRRFGSFSGTVELIKKGGFSILYALASHRAEQCGFQYPSIYAHIIQDKKISKQEAEIITKENLPQLLLCGAVRRGFAIKCPNCDLKEWYSVESLKEQMLCVGCAELFQLNLQEKLDYSYKINELARR